MSLITVHHARVASARGLLGFGLNARLGCVLSLAMVLGGCALDAAPEGGEPGTTQSDAELSLEEADESNAVAPTEEQEQDVPGGEIGDDSSDPTPDPWHSTDPTPDPWDEVDDGMGYFIAPHQER